MKRLLLILLLAGWAVTHAADKPNIVLILAEDIGEQRNRAAEQPERAERLEKAWLDWSAALPPRATPKPPASAQGKARAQDRGALTAVSSGLSATAGDSIKLIKKSDSVVDPEALHVQGGAWGNAVNGQSFQQEALTSFKGWQYATYYDARRRLCLARREMKSSLWEVIRLGDYVFKGNDSHNVSVTGICPADGTIHLAFDHHGHKLHYRRSVPGLALRPRDFSWKSELFGPTIDQLEPGKKLSGVTYPRFVRTPNGSLQFGCRIGGSGNGDTCLADYDPATGTWKNFGAFIGRHGTYKGSEQRNAYLNGLTYTKGRFHVSWCWRESGDPMTNHDLAYAWSDDDGISWRNDSGLPCGQRGQRLITLDSEGVRVAEIGMNRGLVNATTQAVDGQGRMHLMAMHVSDAAPDGTNWSIIRRDSRYFHYWRKSSGRWLRNELGFSGCRPQMRFDGDDNAFLVFTGDRHNPSPELMVAASSARIAGRIGRSSTANRVRLWVSQGWMEMPTHKHFLFTCRKNRMIRVAERAPCECSNSGLLPQVMVRENSREAVSNFS